MGCTSRTPAACRPHRRRALWHSRTGSNSTTQRTQGRKRAREEPQVKGAAERGPAYHTQRPCLWRCQATDDGPARGSQLRDNGTWIAQKKKKAQRYHRTPGAPRMAAAGHGGMARLPRKQNRAPALRGPQHRIRTHASPPPDLGREVETRENPSTAAHPWDAGSGRLSRTTQALWRRPPAPAAWAAGRRARGGGAPT
jgi:hypothetical protein